MHIRWRLVTRTPPVLSLQAYLEIGVMYRQDARGKEAGPPRHDSQANDVNGPRGKADGPRGWIDFLRAGFRPCCWRQWGEYQFHLSAAGVKQWLMSVFKKKKTIEVHLWYRTMCST